MGEEKSDEEEGVVRDYIFTEPHDGGAKPLLTCSSLSIRRTGSDGTISRTKVWIRHSDDVPFVPSPDPMGVDLCHLPLSGKVQ